MAVVAALLLLATLAALTAQQAAADQLPDSYVLLPLSAFTNNTNSTALVAAFSCAATYADSACSGHGSCHLLLDSAANSSRPFVDASAVQPVAVSQSLLDTYGIDSTTPLPAAVCVCHDRWTGRGDYINHSALHGDSCDIDRQVILGISGTLLLLFVPLLLLSFHRLYRWHVWLHSTLLHDKTVSPQVAPRASSYSQAVTSEQRAAGPTSEAAQKPSQQLMWKGRKQLLLALRTHCADITFVHPFCSLVLSLCLLSFFALRLSTDWTIGTSWLMAVLMYVQNLASHIALSANALARMRLAFSISGTRSTIASFRWMLWWTKRILVGVCLYAAAVWLLVLLAHGKHGSEQQLYALLILFVCYTSDMCSAVVMVSTARFITRALAVNLDQLSLERRNERLALAAKIRKQTIVMSAVLLTILAAMVVVAVPAYRQAGMPYFALLRLVVTFIQVAVRFQLIQPPKCHSAVAPSTLRTPAPRQKDRTLSAETLAATAPEPAHYELATVGANSELLTSHRTAAGSRDTDGTEDTWTNASVVVIGVAAGERRVAAGSDNTKHPSRVALPPLARP